MRWEVFLQSTRRLVARYCIDGIAKVHDRELFSKMYEHMNLRLQCYSIIYFDTIKSSPLCLC